MTTGPAHRLAQLAAGIALATAATLLPAGSAAASVAVDQQSVVQGAHATVVFNVRSDRPDVSTTGLEITFPGDHAFTEVLTQPKPGWVITVEKSDVVAASPSPDGSGAARAVERVAKVRWTPAPGSAAIGPNQFDLFSISVGPLPVGAEKLVFHAVQTYSDGQAVSWSEDAAAGSPGEAARPAPVLMLNAATTTAAASGSTPATAPATAADTPAPQPEATSLATAELASASEPKDSQAADVTLGLSIGVGLILLGVAGAAMGRRRTASTPRSPSA